MPISLASSPKQDKLSILVLGPPRIGKTHLISTLMAPAKAQGKKIYIIASDPEAKVTQTLINAGVDVNQVEYDLVNVADGPTLHNQFEKALAQAKAGNYFAVVWDTITAFSSLNIAACLRATDRGKGPNGIEAYGAHGNYIHGACYRLVTQVPCHLVVMSHHYMTGNEIDGQLSKEGPGIIPSIEGGARAKIPALFTDVVYLQKKSGREERILVTSIEGVWGPGCNSYPANPDGTNKYMTLPADLGAFIAGARGLGVQGNSKAPGKSTTAPKGKV